MCYCERFIENGKGSSSYQDELELCDLRFGASVVNSLPDYPGGYIVINTDADCETSMEFVLSPVRMVNAA